MLAAHAKSSRFDADPSGAGRAPLISVIILNYNGAPWLQRCLESLHGQTIFARIEVIVADNNSPDASAQLAGELMRGWNNGRVVQNGANLGFCEGNNRGAAQALGEWLFFLNNDTWLEPECLEKLLAAATEAGVEAGTPLMLNYDDDSLQSAGGGGFDLFGLMSQQKPSRVATDVFVAGGCSYLIRREWFNQLGGFDPVFYMYADEFDLSWRVWAAGGRILLVPAARLHHRGSASVNPAGGDKIVESRTSDTKRYYSNRNSLLLLLKNAQHVLLLLVFSQLLLLTLEALVSLLLVRRWSFIRRAYWDAVLDCWKLRRHILAERSRMRSLRRRNDFGMLAFLRLRPNRWDDVVNLWRRGLPRITAG